MQSGGGFVRTFCRRHPTVRGNIDLHFGTGWRLAAGRLLVGTASVGKDVSIQTNGQSLSANLVGGAWSIGGNLTVHSAGAVFGDSSFPLGSLKVGGDMTVAASAAMFYYPSITGALKVGGDLTISGGSAANELLQIEPASGKIGGSLSITLGGNDESLLFGGRLAATTIGHDANFSPPARSMSSPRRSTA